MLAVVVNAMCVYPTLAQPLKLDAPSASGAIGNRETRALAGKLIAQANRLGTGHAERAQGAARELAAGILNRAGDRSEPAGVVWLQGFTIAQNLGAIDIALGAADASVAILFSKDARELARAIPDDADELAIALRDLFSPLATRFSSSPQGLSGVATWEVSAPLPAALGVDEFSRTLPVDDETKAAASTLIARIDGGMKSEPFRPAATRLLAALRVCHLTLTEQSNWMTPGTHDLFAGQFAESVRALAARDPSGHVALERLVISSELGRLFTPLAGTGGKRCRDALAQLVVSGRSVVAEAPESELRRLRWILDSSRLRGRREARTDERALVRQFRPALRTMLELARIAEDELFEVLPEAIESPDAMSMPKVVGAVADCRRRVEDLELLAGASARVASTSAPRVDLAARDEYRGLSERLLEQAKDAVDLARKTDPTSRARLTQALAILRGMLIDTRDFSHMPGEGDLRAAADGDDSPAAKIWREVLADASPELVQMLDTERSAWVRSWGTPGRAPSRESTSRLRAIFTILALVRDVIELRLMLAEQPSDAGLAANASPSWEVPAEKLRPFAQALRDHAVTAVEELRETKETPDLSLEKMETTHGVAIAAARLNRAMRARITPGPSLGIELAIRQLTAGPPAPTAPLAVRVDDLALISRAIFEVTDALKTNRAVITSCRRVLNELTP